MRGMQPQPSSRLPLFAPVLLSASLLCASLLCTVGCGSQSPPDGAEREDPTEHPTAPGAAATPLVLTQHTLLDAGMRNMQSHTVLAPKGWEVEGGAWWPGTAYPAVLPSQLVSVAAPDGRFLRVSPSLGASDFQPNASSRRMGAKRPQEGASDNGYPVLYVPQDLDEWQAFIQKGLTEDLPDARGLRVTKAIEIPELTKSLEKQLAPIRAQQQRDNEQWAAMGGGTQSSCSGAGLGFEWKATIDGVSTEGLVMLTTMRMDSDTQVGRQTFWSIESVATFGAPKGQLEATLPLLMSIAGSIQPTAEWARMRAEHSAALNRIAAKGAADRARVFAETNREIAAMMDETNRIASGANDRSHAKFINMIRGVDDYTGGGAEETVQLPSGYDHVFRGAGGEFLLTNDALFDPNSDTALNGTDWQPMQQAR